MAIGAKNFFKKSANYIAFLKTVFQQYFKTIEQAGLNLNYKTYKKTFEDITEVLEWSRFSVHPINR